jgi:hypothetical protein
VDKSIPRVPHMTPFLAYRMRLQDSLPTVMSQPQESAADDGPMVNFSKLEFLFNLMVIQIFLIFLFSLVFFFFNFSP